jgi:hypothetical protein
MSKQIDALLKQAEQSIMILKSNSAAKHQQYETLLGRYNLLLAFVKDVANNFCFNQSDDEAMRKWVEFENKALDLLDSVGEIKGTTR